MQTVPLAAAYVLFWFQYKQAKCFMLLKPCGPSSKATYPPTGQPAHGGCTRFVVYVSTVVQIQLDVSNARNTVFVFVVRIQTMITPVKPPARVPQGVDAPFQGDQYLESMISWSSA